MPRRLDPDTIKKLEQRKAKADRDLRHALATLSKREHAIDTRRKIISGALCETHALANQRSEFAAVYVRLLKEYARPEDRWLFGDTFRAMLPSAEADSLLAEGEVARAAADKARAEKRAGKRKGGDPLAEAAE